MKSIKCPNCSNQMESVPKPDITIEKCKSCGGIFLDAGELNLLATGMAGDMESLTIDDKEEKDKFPRRKCPKCNNVTMEKQALLAYSDIIFDLCPKCEGFFLDKGELKSMNKYLESISKKKKAEEFRGMIKDHLVRLDIASNVKAMISVTGGSFKNVVYLQTAVFFKNPFDLGMHTYGEKITDKLRKFFNLFHEQDIQIGNDVLDDMLIIQGQDTDGIKGLLSKDTVVKALIDFLQGKAKMHGKNAKTEIIDTAIICTCGPFSDNTTYDVEGDPDGIVNEMINLVSVIESG
jgi:Zn-finger nucleic acid-binding protein